MYVRVDKPSTATHDIVRNTGDAGSSYSVTVLDTNGNAVDLTGSSVRFRVAEPSGTYVVDDQMTITDAPSGLVTYTWKESDTETAGHFNAQVAVDSSGSTGDSFDPDRFYPHDRYLSVWMRESL